MATPPSVEPEALAPGLSIDDDEAAGPQVAMERPSREFSFEGTLRQGAGRGTLINSAFLIGISALGLVRGFVLAAIVSRTDYGIWGVLVVSLGTLLTLKQVGINDKYIEQDEPDQEVAFQKAFTLDLLLTLSFVVGIAALLPLIAGLYDTPELVLPGLVVLAAFVAVPFQAPLWVFYRRMDFMRQRLIQAIDPIVAFVVTVGLALLGAGYWSFAIGFTSGIVCASIVAVACSPYRLRLRLERGTTKRYLQFSWPLFVASACALIAGQSGILTATLDLGIAATGALALASQITVFTDRVDQVVTGTLYPAICAVKDKRDVLFESFVKSNRLALMWAVPFGFGLALFSSDLVAFAIGERWRPAVPVLEILGVVAAVSHVGFNWTAYFRARDDTRPIAVSSVASMIAFLIVGVPALLTVGLVGFAIGAAAQAVVALTIRARYLSKLFGGFGFIGHAVRAFLPAIPAVAAVLAMRAVGPDDRTGTVALAELALYCLVTVIATWYFESKLLREALGYVRRVRPSSAPAA